MFQFLKKSNTEKKLKEINNNLVTSFSKIKQDMNNVHLWLNYFYQKNITLENSLSSLENQIKKASSQNPDANKLINLYTSFNDIQNQVSLLKTKLDSVPASNDFVLTKIDTAMEKIENISLRIDKSESKDIPDKKTNLKKAILKDINKKSKDYIKNFISTLIKKYDKISASQLKRMVVDEQSLCSKSTFYRVLVELEQSDSISAISTPKEKQFFFKVARST